MRKFYEIYPIWSAVPTELSWSHFQELIRVDIKEEREFYESEAIKSNWGYRKLGRQINTKLYDRYLISQDKNKILLESKKCLIERQPKELLKTPYIFEFAGLKENKNYLETDIEKALISHLTEFLLELGRGFSFDASQQRLKIGYEYYYHDLVFYNRLAKYLTYLPSKEELIKIIKDEKELIELAQNNENEENL